MTAGTLRRQNNLLFPLPKGNLTQDITPTEDITKNVCAFWEKWLECGKYTDWFQLSEWNLPQDPRPSDGLSSAGKTEAVFSSDSRKDLKM